MIFFYLVLGLGVLSIGPVALVLPGLAVGLFLIFRGELKRVFFYQPITGILWLLLISLPWYALIHFETSGEWTRGFFMVHNFQCFSEPMEGHGGPFLVTLGYVLLGLLPFSFYLPQALTRAFKKVKKPEFIFCLIVGIVFILFFSISSTKLPNYTMPCYPFLAILLGNFFNKKIQRIALGWNRLSLILLVLLAAMLPVGKLIGLQMDPNLREVYPLAYWLAPTALITLLSPLLLIFKKYTYWFYTTGFGWMVLALILFGKIYPSLNEINPVTQVEKQFGKDIDFLVYQRMDPAFPFNYQRTFPLANDLKEIKQKLALYPNAYLLTNVRNTEVLDSLENWELVFQRKSVFEYQFTKIYQKRD